MVPVRQTTTAIGRRFSCLPSSLRSEGMWCGLWMRARAGRRAGGAKNERQSQSLLLLTSWCHGESAAHVATRVIPCSGLRGSFPKALRLDTLRRGARQSGEHRNPPAAEARSTLVPDGQRGRQRRLNRRRREQLPGRRQGYFGWAAVAGGRGGAGAVDSGLLMVLGKTTAEG